MDRRANVVELDVAGPAGRIEALNLRLYEPQDDRWSLTFVSLRDGLLTPAVYGGLHDGVGEFYGEDQLDGGPIEVRFQIFRRDPIGPGSSRRTPTTAAGRGRRTGSRWTGGCATSRTQNSSLERPRSGRRT